MSNRRTTKGRVVTTTPVFVDIETKFGEIRQRTNRFVHNTTYKTPKYDRIMSQREKEIRKQLRRHKHGKKQLTDEQKAALLMELNVILTPLQEA